MAGVRRELDALAGLHAGRARVAAFPTALATIVPDAIAALVRDHPGLRVGLVEVEPPEAVAALDAGEVDVALVFEHPDVRHTRSVSDLSRFVVTPVLEEPVHLVRPLGPPPSAPLDEAPRLDLAEYTDADWIAGCARCRADLVARCAAAGFAPRIAFETDDTMAVQALVAAGVGVTLLSDLALRAHHHPGITTQPLEGATRRIRALTLGAPTPPARELLARIVAVGAGHSGATTERSPDI
jgi:DNA-binding transcriptional LysR family regulator